MRKQQLGIIRNKTDKILAAKKESHRKKNRFQMVGKDDDQQINSFALTTNNSQPHSNSEISEDQSLTAVTLFKQAREQLRLAIEMQRKMGEQTKLRLSCLRERENEKYDQNISKLAGQATQYLFKAEKIMRSITQLEPKSSIDKKMFKSIESSLAGEIQQVSRSLRTQEQEYFRKIKSYEGSTMNSAIQLTAEQKKAMESQMGESGWQLQKELQKEQKGKIGQLVGSISRLSALYKELGQLVVAQGTIIDRIDYNLQTAQEHIIKGVVHLQGANEAASSQFADKIIKSLFITIIMLAIILAIKYMK